MTARAIAILMLGLAIAASSSAWGISLEEEVDVGRRVMSEFRSLELTSDPALNETGARLSEVVQRQDLPWRFWIIEDSPSYNAFAAPGGFVFITRTYLEKLSEDEAAFVLGHEMAHVDLKHYERNVKRYNEASIGHLLLNVLVKGGASWQTATDLGATAYMTHYSRALEKEADFAGYGYAHAAGFDARLAVTALSKLGEQPNVHPWIVNLYGTHPLMTSREDRLAAIGGEEPEDIELPSPDPNYARDLTGGLAPLDPSIPVAVRILAPDVENWERWEHPWRKNFTKHLHLRLIPHGFTIAGDDLMYKRGLGDPVKAAQSREAEYLLLVTVHTMSSEEVGAGDLSGTPVQANVDVTAQLVRVQDAEIMWEDRFADEAEGRDILPVDREILYTDTLLGDMVTRTAGKIAFACARAAGAGYGDTVGIETDLETAGSAETQPAE
ncbi:MAG: M48 family metallopeptidase [Armatimonadetes bacterium]|nr:M48 family metallopeptidase [Armatimonadota bacterium]